MIYLMSEIQKISLKPRRQMLWQNESHIWKLKKDVKNNSYKAFTLNDLFSDLFCKTAESDPLVLLNEVPKSNRDKFLFLFPENIINQILNYENEKGEVYLSDEGNNSDYNWPFRPTGDNVKLFKVVHFLFSNNGELTFISEIQNHIVNILSAAQFTNMSSVRQYLKAVGDETIVPNEISDLAHNAFASLVETNDKKSFSLIIANFFISALLGLSPLNEYGKIFYKAYLLNKLGMEYIWTPELITVRYKKLHDIQQFYNGGHLRLSFKYGEEWLNKYKSEAPKNELAIVLQLLGLSLYKLSTEKGNDEFEGRQAEGIELLEECVSTGAADLFVSYTLYEYLKENDEKKAAKYLKTAFAHNYAKAVIEVAFLYLNDEYIFDDVTEELLLEKINYILENEQRNDVVDVGICFYLRGKFANKLGNHTKAKEDFESASKRGNERARQEVSRKKRNERISFPSFINDKNAPCCYVNTLTGNNYTVVSTFPSKKWVIYVPEKTDKIDINQVSNLEAFIDLQCKSGFKHSRLVFLFMCENEYKNLNECLILLDKLFNIVLDIPKEEMLKLIDSIDIFVSAKYETASMLIDSNINDMGKDIYFKVHITDEDRDTVHKLLCDAPLFLPALNGVKKEKFTKVVLFGGSEMNYSFIKESIACAHLGKKHPIDITLLGKNAEILENRFRQECPGVYCNNPKISCIRPQFINSNITDTDFPSCIYGSKHDCVLENEKQSEDSSEVALVNALLKANYFIVDFADDLENIRFAAELRTWLLRSRGTFDRVPFIAVKCSDEQNSYLASHLTLSGQASGKSYFNKYDLFPIGISAHTYSYRNMVDNPVLIDFALRIHKSYYGDDDRAAENDFYSYSYNADSSLSTTIGLCYRFFAAGVAFRDKENYQNLGFFNTPNIESKFEEMYKGKLEDLSSLEQSRWNGFMLSRGWESANSSQVQAYKEQSTGFAHKHTLAKKHPFIKEWEDLNDPDLERVLGILKSKFNYDRKPQVITRKSIEDTAKFFKVAEKKDEKAY